MIYDHSLQATHCRETPSWTVEVLAEGRPLLAGVELS